jgi:hypothetical protein
MSATIISTSFAEVFVIQRRPVDEDGHLIEGQEEHWVDWSTPATEKQAEIDRDALSESFPQADWRAVRKIIVTIATEV